MDFICLVSTIVCGLMSISEYVKTKKTYKLVYVLIWAYYFIGMPILEKVTSNAMVGFSYLVLGCIGTFSFIYWDIVKTKKA